MRSVTPAQLDLFGHVAQAYAKADGPLDNQTLYKTVSQLSGIPPEEMAKTVPIGEAQTPRSPLQRAVRWYQQTLKGLGLLEKVPEGRGIWRLTKEGKHRLRKADPGVAMLACSTDLGLAIWGSWESAFDRLDGVPIQLWLSSPPYPLAQPRAYGNPRVSQFIDFICHAAEPVVKRMQRGGSLCLNVGNDIYIQGMPARSTYWERLVIALEDRLGLYKMDLIPWVNRGKAPGPLKWASLSRQQLNQAWEPIIWMTNDPLACLADNTRVLLPHTDKHKLLIARGGEHRNGVYGDGAYRVRPGSFGKDTAGRIPKNVQTFGQMTSHYCQYLAATRELGIPTHGAPMPLPLVKFLIQFLTTPDGMVLDLFGGKLTTGRAAEELGRPWMVFEHIWEYVRGGAETLRQFPGFNLNPAFAGIA